MARAFAPVLGANGGGAILNVLSAQSWFAYPSTNGYHATKAAQWALTNGIRMELAEQGTLVTGLHLGAVEVLADAWSEHVKRSLADDPARLYDEIRAGIV